jgi:hypothetical protein
MNEKYNFLRLAATIFKIIGWILLIVGIIGSLIAGVAGGFLGNFADNLASGALGGIVLAILGIIFSVIIWVSLLAAAELLYVLMDIERNTREAAALLRPHVTPPSP